VQGGSIAGSRPGSRVSGALLFAAILLAALKPALAEPETPHWEMFSGFEASNNYASGYVGGGYAFGNLYGPGWRVRAVGAVIMIATDRGMLEIRSEVGDVEVSVTKNGEEVAILDVATGSRVKWLASDDYEIKIVGDDNDEQDKDRPQRCQVRWEFQADAFRDRSFELRATSRVAR